MSEPIQLNKPLPPAVAAVEEARAHREASWNLITHFSGLALQGLISGQGYNVDTATVARRAVDIAEAVVKELDRRRSM